MIVVFGEEPPVFSRPTTQAPYQAFQAAGPPNCEWHTFLVHSSLWIFFPKVLEIRFFLFVFLMVHLLPWAPDGAHILWQHNTETDTLSLSLLCACEQSQKKSMKPLTFVSWDLVFCLSLSLLQLPTCLACLQCHHMVQILTLGKISPKPFYLLPTANTYMCDTTNSICLMVEYSLTFIIKTLQHWLCYMYSWILQIRSWNVSE